MTAKDSNAGLLTVIMYWTPTENERFTLMKLIKLIIVQLDGNITTNSLLFTSTNKKVLESTTVLPCFLDLDGNFLPSLLKSFLLTEAAFIWSKNTVKTVKYYYSVKQLFSIEYCFHHKKIIILKCNCEFISFNSKKKVRIARNKNATLRKKLELREIKMQF